MILFSVFLNKLKEKAPEQIVRIANVKDDFFISDIFTNSKYVRNKSVFVCIEGENYDGHQFISESIDKGCVLLISKKEFSDIPNLLVKDPRSLLGIASSIIYENPCDKLLMYAVTGTNGKSTTSFFLKYILDNIGIKTGLLGTILYDDGRYKFEADRTTPEASDIQRYLYIMNKNRCRACVMEVSSHGLCMNRIEGSSYDAGIFTNLSEEHLDYHITMESYFNAKKKLFDKYMKKEWKIATNIDNNYGSKMYEIFNSNAIPYGLNRKNVNCNFFAKNVILENTGSFFDLEINGLFKKFFLPLPGKFNIYNILAAISIVTTQCNDIDKIIDIVKNIPNVPGRFENFYTNSGIHIIIDFAHTPFALLNLLSNIKYFASKRIISVFGHGGGRFAENRKYLGEISSNYADKIILTNGNRRKEDPLSIAYQIYLGAIKNNKKCDISIVLNREKAIELALKFAKQGDIIVISGKGHERKMQLANATIDYNDLDVVKLFCKKNGVFLK
jgi:UDP-N-acetylmuramoyl-L-alanyl-D-glutamate--2,6-diaminopimelate ligase